jgi:hypothetical protein
MESAQPSQTSAQRAQPSQTSALPAQPSPASSPILIGDLRPAQAVPVVALTVDHAAFREQLARLGRSGFLSSEFFLVAAGIGLLTFATWAVKLPPETASLIGTALIFGYKYFRAQVKATNGDQMVEMLNGCLEAALEHRALVLAPASVPASGAEGSLCTYPKAPPAAPPAVAQASLPVGGSAPALSPYICGVCGTPTDYPLTSQICGHCGGNVCDNKGPLDNPAWEALQAARSAAVKAGPLLLLAALFLAGCAQADQTFRSRVQSTGISGEASYDPATGLTTGTGGVTVTFRDPAASGLAK